MGEENAWRVKGTSFMPLKETYVEAIIASDHIFKQEDWKDLCRDSAKNEDG